MNHQNEPPILSLTFVRDPKEQVSIMLTAGSRFTSSNRNPKRVLSLFLVSLVAYSVIMEVYRRLILVPWLGQEYAPDVRDVFFYMLPIWILFFLYIGIVLRFMHRRRVAKLESRYAPDVPITVEIYPSGFDTASSNSQVWFDWTAISQIVLNEDRIELDTEGFVTYIPLRAFIDKADMLDKAKQIRALWHEAVEQARPSQNS